jgi:hypothetical protein
MTSSPNRSKLLLATGFIAWLWLVGGLTFLPGLQLGGSLRGVTEKPPPPGWSLAGLLNGATFSAAEEWFAQHIGFHNLWVRLDNQISYTLLRESPVRESGTRVVVGPDDWLYEHVYITAAITPGARKVAELTELAALIRRVQDKLARRGHPLLLVVAPSKVEIYPEHVPPAHFAGLDPATVTTTYEQLRPLLHAAGVEFFDGPDRFATWKSEGRGHLFARTGTHWSYYAIYHVLGELRDSLNPQLQRPLPELELTALDYRPPQRTDTDLHRLLNLLLPPLHDPLQPFPVIRAQSSLPDEALPRLLWVNDSFGLGLIDVLYHAHAMRPTECLYYNENVYALPGFAKTTRRISDIDWESYLTGFDAVVMVLNELAFEQGGWGFFETLDTALD